MAKKRTLRKLCFLLVVVFTITLPSALGLAQSSSDHDKLEIANEYIRIVVNNSSVNTGRFSVGTTGGDPDRTSDRNKHLIYGGDEPWTSYTTIRIGNENWVFGNPTDRRAGRDGQYGELVQEPTVVDDRIVSKWQTGPVEVTQVLEFARSSTTGLQDTARIEYQLHNTDDVSHLVGLRIVLDTMLGENDGAPFRVNDRALLSDTVFYSHQMPEFWQAFDSLADPQVMAQGTLSGSEVSTPDRVYFTNWGSLADDLWSFDFQPGRDFTRKGEFELDSAMALFWDPSPLRPGETRSYIAYYGLGGVTIARGDLSLGVTSPAKVTADRTHRQSFPIIAYIQNTGRGEARDVEAVISLPEGLQLVDDKAAKSLGSLEVGDTIQTSWQVIPTGDVSGTISYSVDVRALNAESNSVEREIEIVAPAKLQAELRGPLFLTVEDERLSPVPVNVTAVIKNVGGSEAHQLRLSLEHPFGLRLAAGDRTQKYPGVLGPGEEIQVNWSLVPLGFSGNLPYSLKLSSGSGEQVINNFLMVPNLQAKVWVGQAETYGQELRVGDHFALPIWATNIRDFRRAEFDLKFDPDVLEIVGNTLDISQGTLFIDDTVQPPEFLFWKMPQVVNEQGIVRGFAGDRGEERPLPLSFGTLTTVYFRAKASGEAIISLENVVVYDSHGLVSEIEVENRTIEVKP